MCKGPRHPAVPVTLHGWVTSFITRPHSSGHITCLKLGQARPLLLFPEGTNVGLMR